MLTFTLSGALDKQSYEIKHCDGWGGGVFPKQRACVLPSDPALG